MALSKYRSEQYSSENVVESAGAVVFKRSTEQICLIKSVLSNEYLLAKGRRNLHETRRDAALREVLEETGYSCQILPVNMLTRNPLAIETDDRRDGPRLHEGACEFFWVQIRHITENDVKLIWWYIAEIDEAVEFDDKVQERDRFAVEFYGYDEAAGKLTFAMDRDIVQKAIRIVKGVTAAEP
jgi:8-oxo-dGTP pyrophosphatase MutT (NUDIX family)